MIVVDTNIVAHLLLLGEHTETARQTFLKNSKWAAPLLWRSELRNVLARYMKKQHLPLPSALEMQVAAEQLFAGREYAVNSTQVLEMSMTSGCSAYDCEFVALAQSLGVPFVTSDQQVLRAFPATAVSPSNFLQT